MSEELIAEAERAAADRDWSRAADILAGAKSTKFVRERRVWYLSRAKRYEEALQLLSELRQQDPEHYRPYYMIGYQFYEQGKYRESLEWFDAALERNPQHLKSLWRRAYALHALGQENKARVAAGTILRIWRELPPEKQEMDRKILGKASYLLGKGQLRNDPEGAVHLLRQASEIDPDDPYRLYQLAKALRLSGHASEALPNIKRARRLQRGDVHIELEYANSLIETGAVPEALQAIRPVSRRCRGWDAFRAGRLCARAGDRDMAVSLLGRATRDRSTRGESKVRQALEEAQALPPSDGSTPQRMDALDDGGRRSGKIDLVRRKRGFGFLIDDEQGTRRHFRLRRRSGLEPGQVVTFVPAQTDRGPAARDVRPA